MNNFLLVILEQVLEAIYFALFMIEGKGIKNKRLLFTAIMVAEYLMLKHFIKYNIWFQLSYTFMTFINLKVLYKDKAQVTDIFLFAVSSIILITVSFICGVVLFSKPNLYYIMLIVNRVLLFLILYLLKDKIKTIYFSTIKYWNRNPDDKKPKIKSLTLRNISVIVFNLMFYFINIGMIIALAFIEKR